MHRVREGPDQQALQEQVQLPAPRLPLSRGRGSEGVPVRHLPEGVLPAGQDEAALEAGARLQRRRKSGKVQLPVGGGHGVGNFGGHGGRHGVADDATGGPARQPVPGSVRPGQHRRQDRESEGHRSSMLTKKSPETGSRRARSETELKKKQIADENFLRHYDNLQLGDGETRTDANDANTQTQKYARSPDANDPYEKERKKIHTKKTKVKVNL